MTKLKYGSFSTGMLAVLKLPYFSFAICTQIVRDVWLNLKLCTLYKFKFLNYHIPLLIIRNTYTWNGQAHTIQLR
jgi:hypothetical protein